MDTITIGNDTTTSERTYYHHGQPAVGPVEIVSTDSHHTTTSPYGRIVTVTPTRQSDRGITPGWWIELDPNPENRVTRGTWWINVVDTNPDTCPNYEPLPYVYDGRPNPNWSECD